MTILIFGPAPVAHDYLFNTFSHTKDLLIISSTKKIQEEWRALSTSPMVINPQHPRLSDMITTEFSHVIIEQAQNFKNITLETIFSKHPNVIYTHSHLFKQLRPDEMKRLFNKVIVTKTRYFSTIATVFNIPVEYGESQTVGSVQLFSSTGQFLGHETPMKVDVRERAQFQGETSTEDQEQEQGISRPLTNTFVTDSSSTGPSTQSLPLTGISTQSPSASRQFMSLLISMNPTEKDALAMLARRFSKNIFTKDVRVKLHPPVTNTYQIEVEYDEEYGAMVCTWLYHLGRSIKSTIPSQAIQISFTH